MLSNVLIDSCSLWYFATPCGVSPSLLFMSIISGNCWQKYLMTSTELFNAAEWRAFQPSSSSLERYGSKLFSIIHSINETRLWTAAICKSDQSSWLLNSGSPGRELIRNFTGSISPSRISLETSIRKLNNFEAITKISLTMWIQENTLLVGPFLRKKCFVKCEVSFLQDKTCRFSKVDEKILKFQNHLK